MGSLQFLRRAIILVLIILMALSTQGVSENDITGAPDKEKPGTVEKATNEVPLKLGTGALLFIIFVVAIIPFFIVMGNVYGAYKYYGERQKVLSDLLKTEWIKNKEETSELIKWYISMTPVGLESVARSAMAISIIVILGVAVVFLLIYPPKGDPSMVKDVLLILTGAISSIVGFYFGGRTGGESEATPGSQQTESPAPPAPTKPPAPSASSAPEPQ